MSVAVMKESVRIGFRFCNSLRTIDMRHYCNGFGRGWSGRVCRPLDVPLTDSAAPAETTGQRRDGTCQDETSGACASARRCSTFPRTKPRCCAITRCPTTTSSRSGCGAGDTTGWVSHSSFVPSDIRGEILAVGEAIPLNVLGFIAAQLGMGVEDLDGYAIREETRREQLAELRRIYGYRMFSGRCVRDLKVWLQHEEEAAHSNEGLARRFVEECQRRQMILPGLSVLERLCADALVAAERRIETRIAAGLDDAMRLQLDRLLTPAAHRGSGRRHEPVRLVTPVRGGAELGRLSTAFSTTWNSCRASSFPPSCWTPFLRIASPVFAARGSATSQRGCATFPATAVSPSSPSVSWNGAAPSPMP